MSTNIAKDGAADELSLSGLTMPDLDTSRLKEAFEAKLAEQERYRQMYGDGWYDRYLKDHGLKQDYDHLSKRINIAIYKGKRAYDQILEQESRMREIFGDEADELWEHEPGNHRVAELMVADAIRTGKWKELPDELQAEYHRKVGDGQ